MAGECLPAPEEPVFVARELAQYPKGKRALIVLSGGITNVGDMLLTPLKSAMNSDTEITVSKLKGDAGTIGAALLIV